MGIKSMIPILLLALLTGCAGGGSTYQVNLVTTSHMSVRSDVSPHLVESVARLHSSTVCKNAVQETRSAQVRADEYQHGQGPKKGYAQARANNGCLNVHRLW